MTIVDYINEYKDTSFKKVGFNELDAAIFAQMSYFPFDLFKKQKNVYKTKDVLEFIKTFKPKNTAEHKLFDIYVMTTICHSKRYKGIKFCDFIKKRSNVAIEQFQAVTISMKTFFYISFGGTDATALGWREDFNMAYLDIVPSEIDAIEYANLQVNKHSHKKIYLGGHSKGGRLAVRAGKGLEKKDNLGCVFSFDGPNFTDVFYDEKYEEIKPFIYEYAPNESIVGRLINDREKIIVESNAKMLHQHSLYTWKIKGTEFIHVTNYTDKSNKIAKISKDVITKYDIATKSVFVNTLFDLLDKLEITELRDDAYNKMLITKVLSSIRIEWKNIPKENRTIVLKILFSILISLIKK